MVKSGYIHEHQGFDVKRLQEGAYIVYMGNINENGSNRYTAIVEKQSGMLLATFDKEPSRDEIAKMSVLLEELVSDK